MNQRLPFRRMPLPSQKSTLVYVDSTLRGEINDNITLSSEKVYGLDGFVYVNGTLTIQPGTIIVGDTVGQNSVLCVNRGQAHRRWNAVTPNRLHLTSHTRSACFWRLGRHRPLRSCTHQSTWRSNTGRRWHCRHQPREGMVWW